MRDRPRACAGRGRNGAARAAVIALRGITKTYHPLLGRAVRALDDFTLDIADGEVLGIAGPNGAGKSTLLNLLLGFQRPSSGSIAVNGLAPRRFARTYGVGYVSELIAVPPRWRAESALVRYATLAGIAAGAVRTTVDDAVARLGLGEHRDKRIKALSKGNLQRLGVAQATLRPERVYIFDEPTHGLDPVWTARFRDLITELRAPDRTIIIASHNLDELQRVADRVAIIDRGRLQRVVSTGYAPGGGTATVYRLIVAAGAQDVTAIFPEARGVGRDEYDIPVTGLPELNAGLAALLQRGALVAQLAPAESALETQFREAVSPATRGGEA